MSEQPKKTKRNITRHGRLLGGYFPAAVADAIDRWVEHDEERDRSKFLRQAAREKLVRDGVVIKDRIAA